MDINLSLSNANFQYEISRVIYSLFYASIIPSILWIVQRSIGKTNYRDAYLRRDRYHCPITIINIVRTKGKAGYLV